MPVSDFLGFPFIQCSYRVTITGVDTSLPTGNTMTVPSGMPAVSEVVVNSATSISASLTANSNAMAGPQALLRSNRAGDRLATIYESADTTKRAQGESVQAPSGCDHGVFSSKLPFQVWPELLQDIGRHVDSQLNAELTHGVGGRTVVHIVRS